MIQNIVKIKVFNKVMYLGCAQPILRTAATSVEKGPPYGLHFPGSIEHHGRTCDGALQ
jgi:hypothetical protein